MRRSLFIFFIVAFNFFCATVFAQVSKDSAVNTTRADTTALTPKKPHNPRVATRRSAILPGWGQIYNKKHWKLPLIYGALGTTAGIFFYNLKTYKELKLAYIYRTDGDSTNDALIDPKYQPLSTQAIQTNRNLFRQNVDYSVLFFIIFWGLNVVDATVDGHLKAFDVNDNLSLRIHPGHSNMANTTGLSLVLDIHSSKIKSGK